MAKLSPKRQRELDNLHRAAVRAALQAEGTARLLLTEPVERATHRLIAAVAMAGSGATRKTVLPVLRSEASRLQQEFGPAVLASRDAARAKARGQVSAETAPLVAWAQDNASQPPPLATATGEGAALDAFEADRAAASMSTAWSSAALGEMVRWERTGGSASELARALDVDRVLEPRVDRHAAVQSTTAYADEHRAYWDRVFDQAQTANDNAGGGDSGEPMLPYGWLPGTFKVWSAILDRRTCPACFGLDGTMVPQGADFPEGATTPLHNLCRCIVLVTFVDEGLSRKLPGMQIDYEALKGDVKDYFRGQTLTGLMGTRHIGGFIHGTRERTAPETLARAVNDRRGYRAPGGRPARPTLKAAPMPSVPPRPAPRPAAPGYLKEQHTEFKARAYERMLESRVVPEQLRGGTKLLKESRGKLAQLERGGLPLAELKFSREGYREGSFNSVRRAYAGTKNATALATGRAIPPGSTTPLPPIRLGAYPGEGIHIIDGRHRMQVAAENGATHIRAEIYLYDKHADYVWVGTRNIPLPK